MNDQRTERMLAAVKWQETGQAASQDGTPVATHSGVINLGAGIPPMRCYRLSDGRAVIHSEDLLAFLGQGAKQ